MDAEMSTMGVILGILGLTGCLKAFGALDGQIKPRFLTTGNDNVHLIWAQMAGQSLV